MELNRNIILKRAMFDCLNELYEHAQPQLQSTAEEAYKNGTLDWSIYYIPDFIYRNIVDKYCEAYNIKDDWDIHFDLIKQYFEKGGKKTIWVEPDTTGNIHGFSSSERIPPISDTISSVLSSYINDSESLNHSTSKICADILDYINSCQNYYHHGSEAINFRFNISNAAPNSNLKYVREYWRKVDPTIIIKGIKENIEED